MAAIFVPVVVLIALLSFVVWFVYGPAPSLSYAVVSAMTVLVIACPCALGLATPISIMVGVGRAAEHGILIRNGDALQRAGQVDTVVFDKTGTLTEGRPTLTGIYPFGDSSKESLLQLAASIEQGSEHPLGVAIVSASKERNQSLMPTDNFQTLPGFGVQATSQGEDVYLGSLRLMHQLEIDCSVLQEKAGVLASQGETPMYLAKGTQLLGMVSVADRVRVDSAEAVARLKAPD